MHTACCCEALQWGFTVPDVWCERWSRTSGATPSTLNSMHHWFALTDFQVCAQQRTRSTYLGDWHSETVMLSWHTMTQWDSHAVLTHNDTVRLSCCLDTQWHSETVMLSWHRQWDSHAVLTHNDTVRLWCCLDTDSETVMLSWHTVTQWGCHAVLAQTDSETVMLSWHRLTVRLLFCLGTDWQGETVMLSWHRLTVRLLFCLGTDWQGETVMLSWHRLIVRVMLSWHRLTVRLSCCLGTDWQWDSHGTDWPWDCHAVLAQTDSETAMLPWHRLTHSSTSLCICMCFLLLLQLMLFFIYFSVYLSMLHCFVHFDSQLVLVRYFWSKVENFVSHFGFWWWVSHSGYTALENGSLILCSTVKMHWEMTLLFKVLLWTGIGKWPSYSKFYCEDVLENDPLKSYSKFRCEDALKNDPLKSYSKFYCEDAL